MSLSGRFAIATVTSTLVLTGCGSASEPSPPTGIDELVIPTPSIDPADFVDRVDSPWLPLAAGTCELEFLGEDFQANRLTDGDRLERGLVGSRGRRGTACD